MCMASFTEKDKLNQHWKVITVKPVYNDHLYYKIYYLWLIQ